MLLKIVLNNGDGIGQLLIRVNKEALCVMIKIICTNGCTKVASRRAKVLEHIIAIRF
jgi:hypothetical protein